MIFRFGDVAVDTANLSVHVAGNHRPTEPQVIAVLAYLIDQRHRVVSKDELLDEVWGTRFVSAAAVASRIKSARQAVGDTGRTQSVIRTVHGRGYRFVADLDNADDTGGAGITAQAGAAEPSARSPRDPSDSPQPAVRQVEDGWPLVGRNSERDRAVDAAKTGATGGMVLTGPAGLGKTRLARAIIERAVDNGLPVARIHGHPGTASVPLGAIAHLLPPEVTEIAGVQGEMAHAVLLQRARSAIHEFAPRERLVLMVDDVDRIDALSLALLGSLIADRSIYAVMTQRVTGDDAVVVDHLVRSGDLEQVTLAPIAHDQILALAGRVLDGPVQPATGDALIEASSGYPGILRQLIEGGLSNGTLTLRGGVWGLTGGLTPPADMAAAVERRLGDLDTDQRDALELLAIAGDLDLDLAFELVDDEVLDRLELDGMISVREVGASTRLRLAHPLYAEILIDTITPLRDRRQRGRLASALADSASVNVADRLRLVRLQLDSGDDIDSELLIESSGLALIEGDTSLALKMLRRVAPDHQTARHQQMLGEVLYHRGQFDDAYDVWTAIDTDNLDDDIAASVLRRIATWSYYGAWRFTDALEGLDEGMRRFTGGQRLLLESYWCELAAIDGRRSDEVIERAERLLPDSTGHARCDFLSSSATAHFGSGRYRRAVELLDECTREAAAVARTIHWQNSAYADFIEVLSHIELGNLDDGWATFDRANPTGAAPDFGFAAIAAGRLALMAGRWQQVIDWLEPKIQVIEALGITTNGRPLQANAGVASLMLGRNDEAADAAAAMRSDVPDDVNLTALDIRWAIGRIDAVLGDRDAALDDLTASAAAARSVGLHYQESLHLTAVSQLGGAADVVDRLGDLAEQLDGDLIGLRHQSALAVLGDADPDAVLAAFDRRGLVFDATWLRQAIGT